MIGVWLLVFEGEPMAIRFKNNGKVYDLSLDKFNKHVGYPLDNLPCLQLYKNGQYLSTRDEIETGILVEEYTRSLTASLKEEFKRYFKQNPDPKNIPPYVYKSDAELKRERQAMEQKLYEIKNSVRRFLPISLVEPYAKFHLEHFAGNNNAYTFFSKEQTVAIKEYFRWKSKIFFYDRTGAYRPLTISKTKAMKLAQIMGDANDWMYDGTVDTGGMGGGYCELGHALRYEHYARSESLNREVIFGEKCVSDFFDIPKSVINEIINAQQYTQRDIRIMAFLIANKGYLTKVVDSYASYLWDVLTYYKGRFDELTKGGAGMAHFIAKIHKLGLPLPQSLSSTLYGWYKRMEKEKEEEEAKNNPNAVQEKEEEKFEGYELVKAIYILCKSGVLSNSNFAVQVAQTVSRRRTMSDKQRAVLEKELNLLKRRSPDDYARIAGVLEKSKNSSTKDVEEANRQPSVSTSRGTKSESKAESKVDTTNSSKAESEVKGEQSSPSLEDDEVRFNDIIKVTDDLPF